MNQDSGQFSVQINKQASLLPGSVSDTLVAGNRILGVMVNPRSRRNKNHLDEITRAVGNCSKTHYRVVDQPGDVSKVLAEFAEKSVNVLAISGGDGTVSRVLTHLFAEKPFAAMPVIAILRGGTANMIAGDVGSPGSVAAALRRLCDWAESGAGKILLQSRPVLRVRAGGDQPDRYGMFFGAGAVVQGIEYTNENIHSRGLKTEFSLGLGMARSMWGIARQDPRFIRPVDIAIGINGHAVAPPESIVMTLVSGLERLFLNIRPYWGEDNGQPLHVTTVRSPATRLIRNLPSLLRGKPNRYLSEDNGYLSYNVESISLDFDGPFTLDGEILHAQVESGPLEISTAGELVFLRV